MDSPLYSEWLETNRSIAQQVGLSSVPALLIDTDIYIGTYSGRQLQSIINSYLTDDNYPPCLHPLFHFFVILFVTSNNSVVFKHLCPLPGSCRESFMHHYILQHV